jgi:hypothetical protein
MYRVGEAGVCAEEVRRAHLKKAPGGHVLSVTEPMHGVTHSYHLSADFLASYLAEVRRRHPKRPRVNLGCVRCRNCSHYHRTKHLSEFSTEFDAAPERFDWERVFGHRHRSQCTAS